VGRLLAPFGKLRAPSLSRRRRSESASKLAAYEIPQMDPLPVPGLVFGGRTRKRTKNENDQIRSEVK
jgi:hypothetical protein